MPTSIRLDSAIESRLGDLAHSTGRSKAYYLRELIMNGIDELEDYYRASEVMDRVRSGKEAVYSSKQVRQNLGLDD
jgi:RHH-type rel operon transcriptional repressor/antitoxin RelB